MDEHTLNHVAAILASALIGKAKEVTEPADAVNVFQSMRHSLREADHPAINPADGGHDYDKREMPRDPIYPGNQD